MSRENIKYEMQGGMIMDASKTGKLIAAKRKEKGLTQKELAERLKVTDKAVSKWETGRGMPDVSVLEKLAEELGVTVSEMLNGSEVEKELLPETADKIIMDTIKSSEQKVSRKRLIAIGAGVAAAILMICGSILVYIFAQTVTADDIETLEESINNRIVFRYSDEKVQVLKTESTRDKLVVLYTHKGVSGLYIYNESRLFPGRYSDLSTEVMPKKNGEIVEYYIVNDGKTTIIAAGVDFPQEACYYSYKIFGIEQTFAIEDQKAFLDVHTYSGSEELPLITVLNKDKKPLYDDFGRKLEGNWQ